MDEFNNYNPEDRSLEKDLTKQIINRYFDNTESWLRAILRKCIFSLAHVDGETAFFIECPNQAVAKRLSRKTYPLLWFAGGYVNYSIARGRVLISYFDKARSWQCYDSQSEMWMPLEYLTPFGTKTDR